MGTGADQSASQPYGMLTSKNSYLYKQFRPILLHKDAKKIPWEDVCLDRVLKEKEETLHVYVIIH